MATVQAVMGNLTASDRQILTAVNTGASTLSLLGSGFIVMCYLCFKELRKFSFKLVFFLALSDMLYSFFSIVGDPSKGFFCYAQGYSTHFFCVASFLWTTTIAFTLHRTVVKHKTDVEDMEPIFHLYVWGMNFMLKTFQRFIPMTSFYDIAERLPAVYGFFCRLNFKSLQFPFDRILEMLPTIVVVVTRHLSTLLSPACQSRSTWHPPGGTSVVLTVMRSIGNDHGHGHLGNVGAWCWTQTGRTGKAVHFMTFYLPLWGAIIFNGVTYFQVIRMLNNATRMAVGMSNRTYQLDMRADMKALNRWGYYPLILIGSWTFGTINRIHDFIEPGHKIIWLSILDVGMAALMGLFNSIAYGLNSSVRRAIYERVDLLPERFRRGLPQSLQSRSLQQDSELVSLKVQDEQ